MGKPFRRTCDNGMNTSHNSIGTKPGVLMTGSGGLGDGTSF